MDQFIRHLKIKKCRKSSGLKQFGELFQLVTRKSESDHLSSGNCFNWSPKNQKVTTSVRGVT
ncbi:hypothetical protein E4T83_07300 [Streptococcus sp. AN2]|nr:hypothetical protein E4T83_07300 [Streptococcus sp. AN2]